MVRFEFGQVVDCGMGKLVGPVLVNKHSIKPSKRKASAPSKLGSREAKINELAGLNKGLKGRTT